MGRNKSGWLVLTYVRSLLGFEVLQKFRGACVYDNLDLYRSFEIKKRTISPTKDNTISLRVPLCLRELLNNITGESMTEKISSSTFDGEMKFTLDILRISADIGRDFFHEALDSITDEVDSLLHKQEILGTNTILLVGGFAESPMLQHAIKSSFLDQKVVIPKDAGLAVVKGAVIFGYNPALIEERVSKYTYGTNAIRTFVEGKHDPSKKFFLDGEYHCDDLFSEFVRIGQRVRFGEPQGSKRYIPLRDEYEAVDIVMYACTQKSPMYVTDEGCFRLGHIIVKIRDRSVPREERTILVNFTFSGTQIEVTAIEERTGEESSVKVDFLGWLFFYRITMICMGFNAIW